MRMRKVVHLQRWVLGSLVMIWLLMGGLAFAEQLNVVLETGPHDEQALEHLQFAVKSEALDDSNGPFPADLLQLTTGVRPVTIVTSVAANPPLSHFGSTHTRSLVLFTCCYRI